MSGYWFKKLWTSISRRTGAAGLAPMAKVLELRSFLESLEDRTAPAIFTVTNTDDGGAGSLRQAILDANLSPGADAIAFSIGTGSQTIVPFSALPTITEAVAIDATTQPGWTKAPIIELDGTSAGGASGFTITSSGSSVRGFVINRFAASGVTISGLGATGNTIAGNYIGTNTAGTSALANAVGIQLDAGASANTIGGTTAGAGNVIGGNTGSGVSFNNAADNLVAGNFVGINATGESALANGQYGVQVVNVSAANTIGGTAVGAGNVISGNGFSGLLLQNASHQVVQGNKIGTNASGTAAVPNTHQGIVFYLTGSHDNLIGGTVPGAGNLISGNLRAGIHFESANGDPQFNVVQGNRIGTNADGTAALGNGGSGIYIRGGLSNNLIGGSTPGARNLISGNGSFGAFDSGIDDNGSGTIIQGNFIGTDVTGTVALGNKGAGVFSGSNAVVGGSWAAGEGNLISGNARQGVYMGNSVVRGNRIGTDVTGSFSLANDVGVELGSGTLGGPLPEDRNIISGNGRYGVYLYGNAVIQGNTIGLNAVGDAAVPNSLIGVIVNNGGANYRILDNVVSGNLQGGIAAGWTIGDNIVIAGNLIGLNLAGTAAVGNGGAGLYFNSQNGIATPATLLIGTDGNGVNDAAERNVIAGNAGAGITYVHSDAAFPHNLVVAGNFIGTNKAGTAAVPNLGDGIYVATKSGSIIIGGTAAGTGNVIGGNAAAGIRVTRPETSGVAILGNFIGTDAAGTAAIGNATGVLIDDGAHGNTVGGTTASERNVIGGNAVNGVRITGTGTSNNTILGNYIGTNALSGTVAWYRGEGNGADVLGNHNGTLLGNPTFGPGKVGESFDFDGIDDTVRVPMTPALELATGDFTMETWINFTVSTGGYMQIIRAYGGLPVFLLQTTPGGKPSFYLRNSSSLVELVGPAALNDGQWHHIAGTRNGNVFTLYVDGIAVAAENNPDIGTFSTGASHLYIGSHQGSLEFFAGKIDELGLYNRTLTATEVQGIHSGSNGKAVTIGNAGSGVSIEAGATNNTIGGTSAGARNVVSGNSGNGIFLTGAGTENNVIVGNFIGTDPTGSVAFSNKIGIRIDAGANNNTIGGTAAGARNIIGGNTDYGVLIEGASNNNAIAGNYIGTNASGTGAIANATNHLVQGDGLSGSNIRIDGASGTTIGGTVAGAGNLISASAWIGVSIGGSSADGNVFQGNFVGTNASGSAVLGNYISGVLIGDGATNTVVGGTVAGARNVLSGNVYGVAVLAAGAGTRIEGNYIGTDAAGTVAVGNSGAGVNLLRGATGVTVGGTAAGARNVISGNTGLGVVLAGSGTNGNTVLGNYIGTDVTGIADLGNAGDGVRIESDASNNTIGGTTVAARNVISGNTGNGVTITGTGGSAAAIFTENFNGYTNGNQNANQPGTGLPLSFGGTVPGWTGGGVNAVHAVNFGANNFAPSFIDNNTLTLNTGIAANAFGSAYTVSFDVGPSVYANLWQATSASDGLVVSILRGDSSVLASRTVLPGAWVTGPNAQSLSRYSFNYFGDGSGTVRVRVTTVNPTSGRFGGAIDNLAIESANNVVQGNSIGTNAAGTAALGNAGHGVFIESAANNIVGGSSPGERNIISGNAGSGVVLSGSETKQNTVLGNSIGVASMAPASGTMSSYVAEGSAADGSGGNAGTVNGGTTFVNGINGQAFSFDGTGFVRIPNNPSLNVSQLTMAGWIKPVFAGRPAVPYDLDAIFSRSTSNGLGYNLTVTMDPTPGRFYQAPPAGVPTGTPTLYMGINGAGHILYAPSPLPNDGLYHHVAGTYDGSSMRLFVDGVEVASKAVSGPIIHATTNDAFIGRNSGDGGALDIYSRSSIDEVLFAGRALTAAEVQAIAGRTAVSNAGSGVRIEAGASNNTIGGSISSARNIISGNAGDGVTITGTGTSGNQVAGNYIGLNVAGTGALANGGKGVYILSGAKANFIGTNGDGANDLAERNIISGNTSVAVWITDGGTDSNRVAGNYIGLNPTGTARIDNSSWGVLIAKGARFNVIGTNGDGQADAFERNVITGNGVGVSLGNGAGTGTGTEFNVVAGNYIGTDATGMIGLGNRSNNIQMGWGAQNNRIGTNSDGTSDVLERNVISASAGAGVGMGIAGTSGNLVAGNYIGTNATGSAALPNVVGVYVESSGSGNTIGGTASGAGNLISGNTLSGVYLLTGSFGNVVQGNRIGTDAAGNSKIANGGDGVLVESGASGNTIGGSTTGAGNVISGNTGCGVTIDGTATNNNVVAGNYVGTNAAGTAAISNLLDGIVIRNGASGNLVGGTTAGAGNLVSGNVIVGVSIHGVGTTNNVVQGNLIGIDKNGTQKLANGYGVALQFGTTNNTVGGTSAAARNIISGSSNAGVYINSSGTTGNTVLGNYIGTNAGGTAAIGNGSNGVVIFGGASSNIIGGPSTGAGNVISGNTGSGINISGTGTSLNRVSGNRIGTNASGAGKVSNNQQGVFITSGATKNIIGTDGNGSDDALEGNLISGNLVTGIYIRDVGTNENRVAGNIIGLTASGSTALTNNNSGILIGAGAQFNTVGGTTAAERNVASGNALAGIAFEGSGTSNNLAIGNWVGLNVAGTGVIGNQTVGVGFVDGSSGNRLGGSSPAERNIISGNKGAGVFFGKYLTAIGSNANTVTGNYIGTGKLGSETGFGNLGVGIGIFDASSGNLIGGGAAGAGNLISGNTGAGITISGTGTNFNVVAGNIVGLAADGVTARANSVSMYIEYNAADTRVGTDADGVNDIGERNVMSGNGQGIFVQNGATRTVITGNYIGTNAAGTAAIALTTSGSGIIVQSGATNTRIGTNADGINDAVERNVISGNWFAGIAVSHVGTTGTVIAGNHIGTNAVGDVALPNGQSGNGEGIVVYFGATDVRIGTNADGVNDAAERNVISGNKGIGINIQTPFWDNSLPANGLTTNDVVIAGNYIGTDVTGSSAIGNKSHGVRIAAGATNITIGGSAPGEGNIISGNTGNGVEITGSGTTKNVVAGNFIGTNTTGTKAIPNTGSGARIVGGAADNVIGTNGDGVGDEFEGNVLSGNTAHGVVIAFLGSDRNRVAGNYIGVDITGDVRLDNGGWGVIVNDRVKYNTIGTNGDGLGDQYEGNVISGNTVGVGVGANPTQGPGTDFNVVAGNFIGTNATGSFALGNRVVGIQIAYGASSNLVGTNSDGMNDELERNVISGNTLFGLVIGAIGSKSNVVAGNFIGTNSEGNQAIPNLEYGAVYISEGGTDNRIGTNGDGIRDDVEGNLISGNAKEGVVLDGVGTSRNLIAGNRIGTDVTGTAPLPNSVGVNIINGASNNYIGGSLADTNTAFGNVIAYQTTGLNIDAAAGQGNTVRFNQLFNNGTATINGLGQPPAPTLTGALGGNGARIFGNFAGVANRSYVVDFYSGETANEAKVYLGSATFVANALGAVSIDASFVATVPFSNSISAIATRVDTGSSSALSASATVLGAAIQGIPPSAVEGSPINLTAFSVLDAAGISYQWTILKDGLPYADVNGVLVPIEAGITFIPHDDGVYSVSLLLTTGVGDDTLVGPIEIVVDNAAPRGELRLSTESALVGTTVYAQGLANDAGSLDTHTFLWELWYGPAVGPPIDFGAGTNFTFEPVFNGFYRLRLTIEDDDGGISVIERLIESQGAVPLATIVLLNSGEEGDPVQARAELSQILNGDDLVFEWRVTKNGATYVFTNPTEAAVLFVPDDEGQYRVDLRVSSLRSGLMTDATPLLLSPGNLAPRAILIPPAGPLVSGNAQTWTASVTDPGSADVLSYRWTATPIDSDLVYTGDSPSFSFTPPVGGQYRITLEVTDDSGAVAVASRFVTVAFGSLEFTIEGLPTTSVEEGSSFTARASLGGTYRYDWTITRDGLPYQVASSSVPANPDGYTATPFDLPFTLTDNGTYEVTLVLTAPSGQTGIARRNFSSYNVAPQAALSVISSGPYFEDQEIVFRASPNDPGTDDTHEYRWTVNGVPYPAVRANPAEFRFRAPDNGLYTVHVTVTDDGRLDDFASTTVTVLNSNPLLTVRPTATSNSSLIGLELTAKDVTSDILTSAYWQLFQDGILVSEDKGTTMNYAPVSGAAYRVVWNATDEDGGTSILVVASLSGSKGSDIRSINADDVAGVDLLIYQAFEGDDTVIVDSAITIPVILDGGPGDDYLSGGGGNDVLIAGTGSNVLFGNDGDDLLIGGGSDTMDGGAGNDTTRPHFSVVQVIDTQGGIDTLDFSGIEGRSLDVTIDGNPEYRNPFGDGLADRLSLVGDFEIVRGTGAADTFHINVDNFTLFGGEGADVATVEGGTRISINLGTGANRVNVAGGEEITIFGGEGAEDNVVNISGDASKVVVTGSASAPNTPALGALNVNIAGGEEITIFGGENDLETRVEIGGTASKVTFDPGSTSSTVNITDGEAITIFGGEAGTDGTVSIGGAAKRIQVLTGPGALAVDVTGGEEITIFGGESGSESQVSVTGTAKGVLIAGAQDPIDVSIGGGEEITIFGGEGPIESQVSVSGDAGKVRIYSRGLGTDISIDGGEEITIFGGEGENATDVNISGQASSVIFVGGTGKADVVVQGGGEITIFGGTGSGETTVEIGEASKVAVVGVASTMDVTVAGGEDITIFGGVGDSPTNVDITGESHKVTVVGTRNPLNVTIGGGDEITIFGGEGSGPTDIRIEGAAKDVVVVASTAPLSVDIAGGEEITIFGGEGDDATEVTIGGTARRVVVKGDAVPIDADISGGEEITIFSGEGPHIDNVRVGGSAKTVLLSTGGGEDRVTIEGGESITIFGGVGGDDVAINGGSEILLAGGGGEDTIAVTGGKNIIVLTDEGNDVAVVAGGEEITIFGGEGDDGVSIEGTARSVLVSTWKGNDSVTVEAGEAITIFGGEDDDTASIGGGKKIAVILGSGQDKGTVSGGEEITIFGGEGDDEIAVSGGDKVIGVGDSGNDTIAVTDGLDITIFGGEGDDEIIIDTVAGRIQALGSEGDDTIRVRRGLEILIDGGLDRDLFMVSGGERITIFGSEDNDSAAIEGGQFVKFLGDSGSDQVTISGGDSITVSGGLGNDVLEVTGELSTNIVLFGDSGNDWIQADGSHGVVISAGRGDDILILGRGADILAYGDDGDDAYIFANLGPANIRLKELINVDSQNFEQPSRGRDVLDFTAFSAGIDYNLSLRGNDGDRTIGRQTTGDVASWLFGTFEGIYGTEGADRLVGDDDANVLYGNGGDDTLVGNGGDDTLVGGAGNDAMDGGLGNDWYSFHGADLNHDVVVEDADEGVDTLDFSGRGLGVVVDLSSTEKQVIDATGSTLQFTGAVGLENVAGTFFDDRITGNSLDNQIAGLNGNDTLAGGTGNDVYYFAGSDAGTDTIVESSGDPGADTLDFTFFEAPLILDLSLVTVQPFGGAGGLQLSDSEGLENIVGTGFADILKGNANANTISGFGGSDFIDGRAGNDTLYGGLTQVVYLDFGTATNAPRGDFDYLSEFTNGILAADEVIARLQSIFDGLDYRFTRDLDEARAWTAHTGREFVTLVFNDGPGGGIGGESGELDFRNLIRNNRGTVNVNDLLGEANQPSETIENVIGLSTTIAAHELGHMAGLRHADALGPIGSGLFAGAISAISNQIQQATALAYDAISTPFHIMSSPLSLGSTLADAAGPTYFGERELIKLSFADTGTAIQESGPAPGSLGDFDNAIALGELPRLNVYNTIGGRESSYVPGEGRDFSWMDVSAISVSGNLELAGAAVETDMYSFYASAGDIVSLEMISTSLRPRLANAVDGVLRVYDAQGVLLMTSDNDFETADPLIFDLFVVTTGLYFVEVSSQSPTDTGRYELFIARFGPRAANVAPQGSGDTLVGGIGSDTLIGTTANDVFGVAEADVGDYDFIDGRLGHDLLEVVERPGSIVDPINVEEILSSSTPLDLAPIGPQSVMEGSTLVIPVVASGPNVRYHLEAAPTGDFPTGITIDPLTGTMSFTPTDDGDFAVKVVATSVSGQVADQIVQIVSMNVAPILGLSGPNSLYEGDAWIGSGGVADPGDDEWTVTVDFGDGRGGQNVPLNANRGFSLTNPYSDSGAYTVTVHVTDHDGGADIRTWSVTVYNTAPTAILGNSGNVVEGTSTPPLIGFSEVYDVSPADRAAGLRYSYDFDNDGIWDLGGSSYASATSSSSVTIPAMYVNDGDAIRTVRARVYDVDDGWTEYFTSFTIFNAPPTAILTVPVVINVNEGSEVHLSGYGTDPGIDTLGYLWRTIAARDPMNYTSTAKELRFTPMDDDTYEATFQVTDSDGASSQKTVIVHVMNVNPVLSVGGNADTQPGVPFARLVSFTDPGADRWSAEVNYGDGSGWQPATISADKRIQLNHVYLTGSTFTVQVRLSDDDGGSDLESFTVTALNPPTVSVGAPNNGVRYQSRTFTFAVSTPLPNPAVEFEYRINWGDGSPELIVPRTTNNQTLTLDHAYGDLGNYSVAVHVVDQYGQVSNTAVHPIAIEVANIQMKGPTRILVVGGSNDSENYRIRLKEGRDDHIVIQINNIDAHQLRWRDSYQSVLIDAIEIYGNGGDDTIRFDWDLLLPTLADGGSGNDTIRGSAGSNILIGGLGNDELIGRNGNDTLIGGEGDDTITGGDGDDSISAGNGNNRVDGDDGGDTIMAGSGKDTIDGGSGDDFIWAGAGNDRIEAGAGDDVVLGEAGNDTISGGSGRDVLIGGTGADSIVGEAGDDLLIAGYTLFDNDSDAMRKIHDEWTSNNSYSQRIGNLKNGTGAAGGVRLNGNDGANQTVFTDNDVDTLIGSSGSDWFFANRTNDNGGPLDKLLDVNGNEIDDDTDL